MKLEASVLSILSYFFLNIKRCDQSWRVEDWILERCEDLTKKTSKRKFVPVSFCLEIKEKFYRENRGIDTRRKRSWDGVFFATNRSVGKRLRMARWHLTFSPFFSPPPPSSTFPPLPFRRLFQARTIRLNYRGAHGVKWVSARGQESTRNGGRTAFRGLHSEDGFWYLTLSTRNSDRTSRLHPQNHPLRDTLQIFSTSFCWTCSYTETLKKIERFMVFTFLKGSLQFTLASKESNLFLLVKDFPFQKNIIIL